MQRSSKYIWSENGETGEIYTACQRVKELYVDERRRSPYSLLSSAWERPPATPRSPSLILWPSIEPVHQTKSTKPNQSLSQLLLRTLRSLLLILHMSPLTSTDTSRAVILSQLGGHRKSPSEFRHIRSLLTAAENIFKRRKDHRWFFCLVCFHVLKSVFLSSCKDI